MTDLQLEHMMENFYLCSHLPISAFDNATNRLIAVGNCLIHFPLSLISPSELCTHLKSVPFINYNLENGAIITLCPLNPANIEQGVFIIGPYTSELTLKDRFPFKPAHCIGALVHLLYAVGDFTPTPLQKAPEEDYNYHVNRAKEYIAKHYAEPITLDTLSNYLGIHKSYLCTIFKQSTKMSFCQYTNTIRVQESQKLLREGNCSILDIALTTGFSSASYFNTTFKKIVGMTPIEYRNQTRTAI